MSPPLKRGMTAAAFQPLGISEITKERLNRLVIGVAKMAAENFRKRVSRLSRQVAARGAELLAGVGVARRKA